MSARRRFMGRRHWRIYRARVRIEIMPGVVELRYGSRWFAIATETGVGGSFDTFTDAIAYVSDEIQQDEFILTLGLTQLIERH